MGLACYRAVGYVAPSDRRTPSSNVRPSSRSAIHPAQPLALFEAMRGLDAPLPDGMEEVHDELTTKRLGTSRTVAQQIERFEKMMPRGERVPADDVVALLKLVGRRSDAGLVFSDAGRRAGRRAVQRLAPTVRLLHRVIPGPARNAMGFRLATRCTTRLIGGQLSRERGVARAVIDDPPSVHATSDGAACSFYGSAIAEILRLLTDFDGAMLHVSCRTRGNRMCEWRTTEVGE